MCSFAFFFIILVTVAVWVGKQEEGRGEGGNWDCRLGERAEIEAVVTAVVVVKIRTGDLLAGAEMAGTGQLAESQGHHFHQAACPCLGDRQVRVGKAAGVEVEVEARNAAESVRVANKTVGLVAQTSFLATAGFGGVAKQGRRTIPGLLSMNLWKEPSAEEEEALQKGTALVVGGGVAGTGVEGGVVKKAPREMRKTKSPAGRRFVAPLPLVPLESLVILWASRWREVSAGREVAFSPAWA